MKLSIVVPCYNEVESLDELFANSMKAIAGREDIEIVFVNNGSTDSSATIFTKLIAEHPYARLVSVKTNIGYGHGILQGIKNASGEILAWTHADLQADIADVINACEKHKAELVAEAVLIKGARMNRALLDIIFTYGMSLMASLMLGVHIRDINAPPKLVSPQISQPFE